MAKAVGYSIYYYNIGTDAKKQILQQLTNRQEQVFTATNILKLGINIQNIQGVIYIGIPKKIHNYTQESKRAKQNRLKSKAIIIQA